MKIRRLPATQLRRVVGSRRAAPAAAKSEPSTQSLTWQRLTWVDIERPTEAETKYLAEHYPFHPLDLDDCLSKIQLPKIDEYEHYLDLLDDEADSQDEELAQRLLQAATREKGAERQGFRDYLRERETRDAPIQS